VIAPPAAVAAKNAAPLAKGTVKANTASWRCRMRTVQNHLADALPRPLMAQVTLPHPSATSSVRSFDVLGERPPGVTQGSTDSPTMPGPSAFFGAMTA
jgi:hypothetical protein